MSNEDYVHIKPLPDVELTPEMREELFGHALTRKLRDAALYRDKIISEDPPYVFAPNVLRIGTLPKPRPPQRVRDEGEPQTRRGKRKLKKVVGIR